MIKTIQQSDILGALASGLCAIHCMATPFLFIAQSCSTTSACCESGPWWWSSIDYIFIAITFFAVYHSGQHSTKMWVKNTLYAVWGLLTVLVLNEKASFLPIPVTFKYISAFSLIGLHMYNLKYCRCSEESVCCLD